MAKEVTVKYEMSSKDKMIARAFAKSKKPASYSNIKNFLVGKGVMLKPNTNQLNAYSNTVKGIRSNAKKVPAKVDAQIHIPKAVPDEKANAFVEELAKDYLEKRGYEHSITLDTVEDYLHRDRAWLVVSGKDIQRITNSALDQKILFLNTRDKDRAINKAVDAGCSKKASLWERIKLWLFND